MSTYSKFVADIGGTHARFAVIDTECESGSLAEIKVYKCAEFSGATETVLAYRQFLGGELPGRGCIAAAGPVNDGVVKFTNLNWRLSKTELQEKLNLDEVEIVNDFTAVAYSINSLVPTQLSAIRLTPTEASQAEPPLNNQPLNNRPLNNRPSGLRVVIGAGTGLGVAALVEHMGHLVVVESEGGHTRFAPASKLELQILEVLMHRYDYVSMEMLLSGPGIEVLYDALAKVKGISVLQYDAKVITEHALNQSDQHSVDTIESYIRILATFCAENALSFQGVGGVYLSGDIFRSLEPLLKSPMFEQRFLSAGALGEFIHQVPIALVLVPDPGLQGAAVRAMSIQ